MKKVILLISSAMVLFIFGYLYTLSPPSWGEYLLFGAYMSLPYVIVWLLTRCSLKGKIDMIAALVVISVFSLIDSLGVFYPSLGVYIMPMDKVLVVIALLMVLLPLGKLMLEKNIKGIDK